MHDIIGRGEDALGALDLDGLREKSGRKIVHGRFSIEYLVEIWPLWPFSSLCFSLKMKFFF